MHRYLSWRNRFDSLQIRRKYFEIWFFVWIIKKNNFTICIDYFTTEVDYENLKMIIFTKYEKSFFYIYPSYEKDFLIDWMNVIYFHATMHSSSKNSTNLYFKFQSYFIEMFPNLLHHSPWTEKYSSWTEK